VYTVKPSARFKRDLRIIEKRGYDISKLAEIIKILAKGEPLPEKNKDHSLGGNWIHFRECHITPDWLLIYKIEKDILVLTLTRTGTHSDLF
jgi:mRNA interferase YafQ